VLRSAISIAHSNGVVFVTSAGNENRDVSNTYPANTTCATVDNFDIDCTITVASNDQRDNKSFFQTSVLELIFLHLVETVNLIFYLLDQKQLTLE